MVKKISYNRLILRMMHFPTTKDKGIPLYTRVQNASDEGFEGNRQDAQDPIYLANCMQTYNSPTNIRRLFITKDGIVVDYYIPYIAKGEKRDAFKISFVFHFKELYDNVEGINRFDDLISKIANYNRDYQMYLSQKAIDKGAKEPVKYVVDGNVIGVASNVYACNNIEEIYVDWSVLLSDEVKQYFSQISTDAALNAYISGTTTFTEAQSSAPINWFSAYNTGGAKEISKRFPRLKIVGFISNLGQIVRSDEFAKRGLRFIPKDVEDVKDKARTWYERQHDLIQQSNSICAISLIKREVGNTNFITKESSYLFDKNYLKPAVEEYKQRIDDILHHRNVNDENSHTVDLNKKAEEVPVNEADIGEIEKLILETGKTAGQSAVNIMLLASIDGLSKKEVNEFFGNFKTTEGRKFVSQVIGNK